MCHVGCGYLLVLTSLLDGDNVGQCLPIIILGNAPVRPPVLICHIIDGQTTIGQNAVALCTGFDHFTIDGPGHSVKAIFQKGFTS